MTWIDFALTRDKRVDQALLDEHQQRVRNTAINAHALVRGSAGSGKSLILRYRLERILRETAYSDILVLTYNRFMAGWLSDLIHATRPANITCETFNKWAFHHLNHDYNSGAQAFLNAARTSPLRYDAILIDEAQDFEDEWFMGLLALVSPTTNSLFLVYDNAQSVYRSQHRRRADWTWNKLGINVVGRSDILDICYRCSPEIVKYSWEFIKPFLSAENIPISRTNVGGVVEPKSIGTRSSNVPVSVRLCDDPTEIARQVSAALEIEPTSSIAVMMHPKRVRNYQSSISAKLTKLGVPHHAPASSQLRNGNVVTRPCVVVDSWNALKGVEFDAAILVNAEHVAHYLRSTEPFPHIAGLYAAMTRARDHLIVTYAEDNEFSDKLRELATTTSIG